MDETRLQRTFSYPIAQIVCGVPAGARLVIAGEGEESLLGVGALASAGFWLDPTRDRLVPRTPLRKGQR